MYGKFMAMVNPFKVVSPICMLISPNFQTKWIIRRLVLKTLVRTPENGWPIFRGQLLVSGWVNLNFSWWEK